MLRGHFCEVLHWKYWSQTLCGCLRKLNFIWLFLITMINSPVSLLNRRLNKDLSIEIISSAPSNFSLRSIIVPLKLSYRKPFNFFVFLFLVLGFCFKVHLFCTTTEKIFQGISMNKIGKLARDCAWQKIWLCDAQNVCAITIRGTVLKDSAYYC